jgi:hypothetical protein
VKNSWRKLSRLLVAGALAGGVGFAVAAPIPAAADEGGVHTCAGTPTTPGVLSGRFETVVVQGACEVNAGAAIVEGNLTVAPGGVLLAAFALNDVTGHGLSRLSVGGDLIVSDGATALLGCEPGFFTCLDDPNPTSPTLFSHDSFGRDVIGDQPLGIIIHSSTIEGNVTEHGGGGGFNCTPTGVFTLFNSPVFSDYEDNWIGGNATISDITSCYLGIARNHVVGDLRVLNNQYADPDAIEITSNHIAGDLVCRENSAVWDSSETSSTSNFPRTPKPNSVGGDRAGQCVLATKTTLHGHKGPGPF